MGVKLINVGYGNFVSADRLISIVGPESAPVKRIVQEAREGHTPHRRILRPPHPRSAYHGQRARRALGRAARNRGAPAR